MALLPQLKRSVRAALQSTAAPAAFVLNAQLQLELARELGRLQAELRSSMPENPAGYGYKVYSQADEDGIVANVCERLGLASGMFAEIGCGDGRENNTHLLLLKGWKGIWIDGNPSNIGAIRTALPASRRLQVIEAVVTRENVVELLRPALAPGAALDLLSVDVDGNDLPIAQAAVAALAPKIVVAEYNAKFPYPLAIGVSYDPRRAWQGDDYHGASLAAWVEALPGHRLVCCNLAGTNSFFVRRDLARVFDAYPPERLYQPARFHLTAMQSGHRPTLSFLADALAADRDEAHTGSAG
jgi:hypothetical protein